MKAVQYESTCTQGIDTCLTTNSICSLDLYACIHVYAYSDVCICIGIILVKYYNNNNYYHGVICLSLIHLCTPEERETDTDRDSCIHWISVVEVLLLKKRKQGGAGGTNAIS